ncbi:unknown [Clostridium sp. CAG:448]|nr:unknown [Clostridium sp. CAG:448]
MRRQNHVPVALFADDQLFPFHTGVAGHENLVAQMKRDMLALQGVDHVQKGFVVSPEVLVVAVVIADPGAGLRVQNQGVKADTPLGKQHTDAGIGVDESGIILPPGLLVVHCRRIVALAQSACGIAHQVLTHQVDAAHRHPLVVAPQLLKADVVSAQREGFGEHLPFAGLRGGGRQLMLGQAAVDRAAKPVHPGNMQIFIVRHAGAVGNQLRKHALFQHQVPRELEVVALAPVVNLLHVVFGEQLGHQAPELHSGAAVVTLLQEQLDQVVVQLLAVCLLVFLGQNKAPRNAVAGNLRLVGKEAVKGILVFGIVRLVNFV